MSVVVTKVLKDEIVMVADSQITCYDTVDIREDGKIFQVGELTIGSGLFYALGALHAGASPEKAVEAACDLNIYCQRPVNVFKIEKEGELA